jgi:hypothetical protein
MSWIDRINNIKLTITTGDGSVFTPLYKNASFSRNMNASAFNFNETDGTLVKRGKAESAKFPITLYFQGDDNLEESERFNRASLDTRPMKLTHPVYGDLLVQPVNLNFDNSGENVTIVTGQFFETIQDTFPETSVSVKEEVTEALQEAISLGVNNFGISEPSTELTNTVTANLNQVTEQYEKAAVTDIDLQAVQDASNEALRALANFANDPITFMDRMAVLFRVPAKFYAGVQDRIAILLESWEDLKTAIGINSSGQEKLYLEISGVCLVNAINEASVTETQTIADDQQIDNNTIIDYNTRSEVFTVVDSLKNALDDFFDTIGLNQSEVDATPESYTPKQDSCNETKEATNKASGQLIQIAVDARQERVYSVPYAIGLIQVHHRLLGNVESESIQRFAENNKILMSEWMQIRPPRKLIYYV